MPRREGVAEEERSSVALAIPACVLDERLSTRALPQVRFRACAGVHACEWIRARVRIGSGPNTAKDGYGKYIRANMRAQRASRDGNA